MISCKNNEKEMASIPKITYPETKKVDTIDTYFGKEVPDPYRWLEDDRSKETEDWVKAQNATTYNFLNKIPYRDTIKDRLTSLWNYERLGAPFKEGNYTYFRKNDGLQNQYVYYRYKNGADLSTACLLYTSPSPRDA